MTIYNSLCLDMWLGMLENPQIQSIRFAGWPVQPWGPHKVFTQSTQIWQFWWIPQLQLPGKDNIFYLHVFYFYIYRSLHFIKHIHHSWSGRCGANSRKLLIKEVKTVNKYIFCCLVKCSFLEVYVNSIAGWDILSLSFSNLVLFLLWVEVGVNIDPAFLLTTQNKATRLYFDIR